jgi:hypothetical protein
MNAFWLGLGVCGLILQLVIIFFMTQGFFRRYPWVFLYLLTLFLTGVADSAGAVDPSFWEQIYENIYFLNDIARYLSGYLAVISLYFVATAEHSRRAAMRTRVLAAALAAVVLAFAITPGASAGRDVLEYFQIVSRNLGFIATLLNVVLWVALVKAHTPNFMLLLVSGGLGINMAGSAIAHSLYIVLPQSDAVWTLTNLIGVGSHFLCLGIWLWALRYDIRLTRSLAQGADHIS